MAGCTFGGSHRSSLTGGVTAQDQQPQLQTPEGAVTTEESLKSLGLETIDVQQFHVWSDEWVNQGDWLEAVQKPKEQRKLKYFGVSINDFQPENAIKLIETGVVDTVQVIYNIFEQSPEDQLFPACERHQVGVIVRVALDEGGLTGKITPNTAFEESDFRSKYFRGDRKQQVYIGHFII
jgi:aryl-alcohol dehydrogenase-like predicted oxidoreductase